VVILLLVVTENFLPKKKSICGGDSNVIVKHHLYGGDNTLTRYGGDKSDRFSTTKLGRFTNRSEVNSTFCERNQIGSSSKDHHRRIIIASLATDTTRGTWPKGPRTRVTMPEGARSRPLLRLTLRHSERGRGQVLHDSPRCQASTRSDPLLKMRKPSTGKRSWCAGPHQERAH
jgi:hypothetical protein